MIFCLALDSQSQVPAPKHEAQLHHIFSAHRDNDNLPQRFNDLQCALVLIQSGPRLGTGFYISAEGDLATASHVLGDRTFTANPDGSINADLSMPPSITITDSKGKKSDILTRKVESNPDAWTSDVARIATGEPRTCWLREADDLKSRPGEHVIALGYPGLSFQALTIYTGVMSARLKTNLPTLTRSGQPFIPTNDFIRVQMPISTGLSGAPVIDDENRVLGVVTNAGGWTGDLDNLLVAFRSGAFNTVQPPPNPNLPPNAVTFTLNSMALTGELAGLFHDFASPGYGDAVPLRYLRKPQPKSPQPSSHSH